MSASVVVAAAAAAGYRGPTRSRQAAAQGTPDLVGRLIAVGLPGAAAVSPVGRFLPGGPFHDKPEFAATTEPGAILDPARLLVASRSNFGAPVLNPALASGSLLSIDPTGSEPLAIPPNFAAAGGQVAILDGRVRLLSAQSPSFRNGITTPDAVTADLPGISNPLGLSNNNAFGRIWPANAPTGLAGPGNTTILDPDGVPLAGAPAKFAGGVFAGDLTNRRPAQLRPGALLTGGVGVVFLGKSPDGTGRAVFAVACADGSVVQVQTEQGVDGLAPAGTVMPLLGDPPWPVDGATITTSPRLGAILNFEPLRIIYLTDPIANAVVALTLEDDGTIFLPGAVRRITSPLFDVPVDLAPALPETADTDWASNTTLFEGADFYVLNRGSGTIVRVRQDGTVVAARRVVPQAGSLGGARLNGIGVAPDGSVIWVTVSGTLPGTGVEGAVLELPAFDGA